MKFRNLFAAAATAAMSLTAHATTLVVPAAGTGPGANGSHWQTELTLHTAGPRAVDLSLFLHQGSTVLGPSNVTLQPRETLSIADVVRTRFNVTSGTGAIVIAAVERDLRTLAVTSRTTNVSASGEFGQDIPAVSTDDANDEGDIVALHGPSDVASTRFNFGVFAHEATSVKWELIRANGTVAATAPFARISSHFTLVASCAKTPKLKRVEATSDGP